MAIMFAMVEDERWRIIKRTGDRLQIGRGKPVRMGRKPKLTSQQTADALKLHDNEGETLRSIKRSYNVGPQTISRLVATS